MSGPPEWTRSLRSLPSKTVAFVLFVCGAIAVLQVWREYQSYDAQLIETKAYTLNLAKSLAQYAEDTVEMADGLLVSVVEHFQNEEREPGRLEKLRSHLVVQSREAPRLRGLFIFDERGDVVTNSLEDPSAIGNNSDRSYFQFHATDPNRTTYIGPPVRSRSSGKWVLGVSRRLSHADGSFAGVAVASIDIDYFSRFFSQFDLKENGNITLFRHDGTILARWPYDEAAVGRVIPGATLFTEWKDVPFGNRRHISPLDGIDRISGFRRGARYGLVLQAAVATDSAFAEWRYQSTWRGFAIALLIILIAVFGLRMAEQVRRREDSEAALQDSEARFRVLAENSSDMVSHLDADGTRIYVSPAAERLLGWRPEELEGQSVFDQVHSDDQRRLAEAAERLRRGDLDETTLDYRICNRTGREIWVESSLRVLRDPETGAPKSVVAVSRDVTDRKTLEAQLTAMARTDGLTGLANRRRFDEALVAEWRRAERERIPLSLMLLDLDRFKRFNDSYGHQAGDECLRVVAGAISNFARQPGDLVARYGGEEIVLLLPGANEAAAARIAERMRAAVQALALRHEGNQPMGVVTASIGVATATPALRKAGYATPEALLEAADHALYAAKNTGRNRAVPAPVGGARQDAA